ncbi:glycosyltransferase [Smaragdicoccus niigatensis]|uniref:glycosyltransferase n=1 Tax=Smaragdicoccus niigatensis TaxID=359359 RepID=UPI001FE0D11B|nr:glycosyltransferase [Smaragdicoccus niigatensis]
MKSTAISYEHMYRLSDVHGIFEHAEFTELRPEHGYCLDDVARALIVCVREPDPTAELTMAARTYFRFVTRAQSTNGRFRNRMSATLAWEDVPSLNDHWGRALWALGSAVSRAPHLTWHALEHFERGVRLRSEHTRAMAFAGLGAAEVLKAIPRHAASRALLISCVERIGSPAENAAWRWPEPRLTYSNASLADVLIAAGSALGEDQVLRDGISMLEWLLDVETSGDHISATPVGGWQLGEPRPAFDQQPIEVAALADACARAFDVTGDSRWAAAVLRCEKWFLGANDSSVALLDQASGGGCDGLQREGRNENQGAESTLAMLSTFQQARRIRLVAG